MLKDKSARRHRSSGRPGVENTAIRNVRSQSAYHNRPKKDHTAQLAHAPVYVMVSSGSATADTLRYHSVGYMQIILECMHAQAGTIYGQGKAIGYPSAFVFIEGAKDCDRHMSGLLGLGGLARPEGGRIDSGAKVLCFERANGASSTARAAITGRRSSIATHGVCMDLFELAKELEAQFN